jgi:vacuolar-type H+-ATPase subunit H
MHGKNQSAKEKQADKRHSTSPKESGLNGGSMQGAELLQNLAALDREFEKKLEEARRSADRRIANAQDKARRILKEAEIQIRQMQDASKVRITVQGEKLAAEAQTVADAEAERIRQQAEPNIEPAVSFVLSEVLP